MFALRRRGIFRHPGRHAGGVILNLLLGIVVIGVIVVLIVYFLHWRDTRYAPQAAIAAVADQTDDPEFIRRGEYLVKAGDCLACHVTPSGVAFAGGLPFPTPFGTIYSPNITADTKTGIGNWSDADFVRALHKGVGKDGKRLYPAFPYPSYTKLSVDDILAIKAYLFSLKPVQNTVPDNELHFPFSIRFLVKFWNILYFDEGRFQPQPQQSESWNRGAFLVEALGHCGDCHTSRNLLMGPTGDKFAGSEVEGWHAYNITPDVNSGIGTWSRDGLVQYLATGIAPNHAAAQGPMADVVQYSTRFLSENDLQAMATYLQSLPAIGGDEVRPRDQWGEPAQDVIALRGAPPKEKPDGAQLYIANCASCHNWTGAGIGDSAPGAYPALIHNPDLGSLQTRNLVNVILSGVQRQQDEVEVFMPAFAGLLDDQQIAALSNYILQQFGNSSAAAVTAQQVASQRSQP